MLKALARTFSLLAAVASLAACESDGTGGRPAAVASIRSLETYPEVWLLNTSTTAPVRISVRDDQDRPVAGAELHLGVSQGSGAVPTILYTDRDGGVTTTWTGLSSGYNELEVRAEGAPEETVLRIPLRARLHIPLVLNVDSLTMAGPGCYTELSAASGGNVTTTWSLASGGVLHLTTLSSRTGSNAAMYQGIVADAPGTTQVIARNSDGEADTVRVRVLNASGTVDFFNPPSTPRAPGDTLSLQLIQRNACGQFRYSTGVSGVVDTARVRVTTLTPALLTVLDPVAPEALTPVSRVVTTARGTGILVATFRGGADTIQVVVQ